MVGPDATTPAATDGEEGHGAGSRVEPSVVWISWLFTIGAACFAVASIPMLAAAVADDVIATTYFVGSVFFTGAAVLVVATTAWHPRGPDWWAATVQLAGTVWFNLNTFDALQDGLSTHQENLRVWTPDFLGSICFIVASGVAWWAVCRRPWCVCPGERDWEVAALNLAGSVLFLAAAFAAFVRPATGDPLDASLANSGTLAGALCFLVGARLLLHPVAGGGP